MFKERNKKMELKDAKIGVKIRIVDSTYSKPAPVDMKSSFFGKTFPIFKIKNGKIGIRTGCPEGHTHWFYPSDLELVKT